MILLQPELIPNEYKTLHGITKGSRVVDANWLHIYSYLQPSYFARIRMKCSCRLFNDVEKMITFNPKCSPLEPIPLYTSFPHPNYASLRGLTNCLNALSKKEFLSRLPSAASQFTQASGNIIHEYCAKFRPPETRALSVDVDSQ